MKTKTLTLNQSKTRPISFKPCLWCGRLTRKIYCQRKCYYRANDLLLAQLIYQSKGK